MTRGNLFGKGAVYTVASTIQLASLALVTPILTRLLPQAEFGHVAAGFITLQLSWILASLGLPAAITRQYFFGSDGPMQARRLIAYSLVASALTCGALLALAPLWSPVLGFESVTTGVVTSVVAGSALASLNATQAYQRARQRPGAFLMTAAISVVVGHGLGILACLNASTPTHSDFLQGLMVGNLVGLGAGLIASSPKIPLLADLRAVSTIGLPTLPHMVGVYLTSAQDRVVVSSQLGASHMAQYQAAFFVGSVPLLLLQAFNNAWAPLVLGTPEGERAEVLRRTTRQLAWLVGSAVLATMLLLPLGLWLVAPASYDLAALAPVAATISAGAVPALMYLARSHLLFVTGNMRPFLVVAPLSAACGFAVSLGLVSSLGLVGVAAGAVSAQLVLAAGLVIATRRLPGTSGLGRALLPAVLLAAIGAAVASARFGS